MNPAEITRKLSAPAHQLDRAALLSLQVFLGVTATIGGIGILSDWWGLSLEWLKGSPFSDYTIPGLALILVGASALVAVFVGTRRHALSLPASVISGLAIVIYELVEVAVVPFHWLQVFYVFVGLLIVVLTGRMWMDRSDAARGAREHFG